MKQLFLQQKAVNYGVLKDLLNNNQLIKDDFEIPEKYPKPTSELLNTTHTHILSMTFIFLIIGVFFFFNSLITGMLKTFLIIEPFISILLTLGGIWLIRFIHSSFSYLIIISGILMYLCFFIMIITIFYELIMNYILF